VSQSGAVDPLTSAYPPTAAQKRTFDNRRPGPNADIAGSSLIETKEAANMRPRDVLG